MTEQTATELDKTRRYLVPIGRLRLPSEPDVVHLTVYRWVPRVQEWFTGLALCGHSTEGEPLPAGTEVTCSGCREKKEDYERYLAPAYRPEAAEKLHQAHLEVERRLAVEAQTAEAAIARVRGALEELKARGATGMQFYAGVLAALEEPKRRTR